MKITKKQEEGVILVGYLDKSNWKHADPELEELTNLVHGAGGRVALKVIQKRDSPDPAYLIGKGKTEEIKNLVEQTGVRCVIFDTDLTPTQQRNLETALECKILDRTRLILDVFARRARTKEGILQVELAQHMYLLPRLTGKGGEFMQQSGGIGARGPGERALEYDRRRIRIKIQQLKKELARVVREREVQRRKRVEEGLPRIAILGYTNVGKSSLLNRLITEHKGPDQVTNLEPILADDRYFATLDPTTRRIHLTGGMPVLFTDTVGFIRELPELLAVSFRATLEEIKWAQMLLIVSDPTQTPAEMEARRASIAKILSEFKLEDRPRIEIFSKADAVDSHMHKKLERDYPHALWVSSQTGEGIDTLLKTIEKKLIAAWPKETISVRAADGFLLREIYSMTKVLDFQEKGKGFYRILIQAPQEYLFKIKGKLSKLRSS